MSLYRGAEKPAVIVTPTYTQDVGGAVFSSLYEFGRGSLDRAKEKLVNSFLKSKTGQELEAEALKQKSNQYAPFIFGAIVLIFLGGFLLRRK